MRVVRTHNTPPPHTPPPPPHTHPHPPPPPPHPPPTPPPPTPPPPHPPPPPHTTPHPPPPHPPPPPPPPPPYILAIYMIVAFKFESHVTGHQIYYKSSLITQNVRDYVKLRQKMKSITLSCLIFQLENILSYRLLVIIIPVLMRIWCPGPRLNIKTVLSRYGYFHVKDKTAVRTSYL